MMPSFKNWFNSQQQQEPSYRMTDAEARAAGLTPPPTAVTPKKPGFFSFGKPKQATVDPAASQRPAAKAVDSGLNDRLKDQWTANHMGVTDGQRAAANARNTVLSQDHIDRIDAAHERIFGKRQ